MKYKENCDKCQTKANCEQYRPINLQETIECINAHKASEICKRSIFKYPALVVLCGKTPKALINELHRKAGV